MNCDDPIRLSVLGCLAFPVMGDVPLSAIGKRLLFLVPTLLAMFWVTANPVYAASMNDRPQAQIGIASWYGAREAGRKTASGAIFDPGRLSAAHRTLKLGTCVRVTDLANARFVIAPVIDRGPYIRGRLIDLSRSAAQVLGMTQAGLARVRIEVVASCRKDVNAKAV